jgi:circadian clock protein KaiC
MSSTGHERRPLPKSPTGIQGLDEVTGGGLPTGRPTLVCGGPGCGKTLLATEFLVRGATEYGEPGVFMVFEETAGDLAANVRSLGFDLEELVAEGRLYIDHVRVERQEIEEAGDYDLEGLFVRLGHAIQLVGAKRVALDTIETLFAGFQNAAILRSELKRLFQWLKDRGVTAVITGERGETTLTRHGLEEYVSDCVIVLDHRVDSQVSTRRLRIVKYRGSEHGTNEYPFLIDRDGFCVVPITSAGLDHEAYDERVSTGIPALDEMLGGEGFYRGTTVLVSGTAGTGKTTTCSHFVAAACRRGERALYFAFEESPAQIARNMRSVGIDFRPHVESGLLRFQAARPSLHGLETHLARVLRAVDEFAPHVVILDPITALLGTADSADVRAMVTRLIDALKERGITSIFTTLNSMTDASVTQADVGISSLVDVWVLLQDIELNGERNRGLYILKARGLAHSNQIREFILTQRGIQLLPAYIGPDGVLTGSSRLAQEARAREATVGRRQELERLRRRLEQRRAAAEAQISALRAELSGDEAEFEAALEDEAARQVRSLASQQEMAQSRRATAGDGRLAGEVSR